MTMNQTIRISWSCRAYKSKVLTVEECMNKTIVRGLIRVVLPELTQQVLRFATAKGCVNFGCITVDAPLISNCRREKILVIGAGPAGLSAASQLSNFGFDVEVFEGEHFPYSKLLYTISSA